MYLINKEKLDIFNCVFGGISSKVTYELNENSVSLNLCVLNVGRTASVELSFKKQSLITSVILNFKEQKGLEIEKMAFTLSYKENERWKIIPIQKTKTSGSNVEIFIPVLYIFGIELNIQHTLYLRSIQVQVERIQLINYIDWDVKATTSFDHLGVPQNLMEQRLDLAWSSKKHVSNIGDVLEFNLKKEYYLSSCILTSISFGKDVLFPKKFEILLSSNKQHWSVVTSQSNVYATFNRDYEFSFHFIKASYVRIVILEHSKEVDSCFQSKLSKVNFTFIPENLLSNLYNSEFPLSLPYASELITGSIRFAGDGDITPNLAVQGNDSRLRDGKIDYPGIVQFARDGEFQSNRAVQSNDSRLQKCTTNHLGIVQLARNGEVQPNKVVQSDDFRLQKGSTESPGIVQFAKDLESVSNLAVQSNDSRLRIGTEKQKGIIQFAKSGESTSNMAVQSNDFRLQRGSTESPGVVQFAKNGQEGKLLAVQSNDSRLKKSTETECGQVILAKNNEVALGKVVQSTDSRLSIASEKQRGVFKVAGHNLESSDHLVVSDDPRLKNAREPLPHTHDYEEKNHSFSSHHGYLHLEYQLNSRISDKEGMFHWKFLTKNFPMAITNTTGPSALFEGSVVVSSEKDTSLFIRSKDGVAIDAYSANQNAAKFMSRTDYALVLPQQMGGISGSGRSLSVEGVAKFTDTIYLKNSCFYALDGFSFAEESFVEGDLVTIYSGNLAKVSSQEDSILGVLVSRALLVSTESLKEEKGSQQTSPFLLGTLGKVRVRIVGKGNSGDTIIYSNTFIGVGTAHSSFKEMVTIFGKKIILLEDKKTDGEKLVECLFL